MIDLKKTSIGIEFGSTRIKAVLIGPDHAPIAQGGYDWENSLDGNIWTYADSQIWDGLRVAYADLKKNAEAALDQPLTETGCIGISGMMHGYLAFDSSDKLLVPFRTWRNTITRQAAADLTQVLSFNIPQRWSISHLYQAILNKEPHVPDVAYITTLSGYVHWKLTGCKVLGVGDASGMFPIDPKTRSFDAGMLATFDLTAKKQGFEKPIKGVLPEVLTAGENAGTLTDEGAKLLDPTGTLKAGVPLCPPEGDAGTGMVATNSVLPRTGNVSAGTSIFAMVVLEKPLASVHEEIDVVTTPAGDAVAMAHCNNCTSDLNAWVSLFQEAISVSGAPKADKGELFTSLFKESLKGDPDCGGVMPVNYFSGEGVTHMDSGVPLLMRTPDAKFTVANMMRACIYSSFATLTLGLDILNQEQVKMDALVGHGGIFKTPGVAQSYLAAAVDTPVTVMATAGEGGAWGMALLADFRRAQIAKDAGCGKSLSDYLEQNVFAGMDRSTLEPEPANVEGFKKFLTQYRAALDVERVAIKN